MNDRLLRTVRAGMGTAALVVISLLGFALDSMGPARAQEAAGQTNSQPGQVVTALLDYKEVSYTFTSCGLTAIRKSAAFKKEPALSRGAIVRGMLHLDSGGTNEMGFVWDRKARKLYLDLNRNLDLTDDPAGVFSCAKGGGPDYYETFRDIHLPSETPAGTRQVLVDLSLYEMGNFSCSAGIRSLYQGKVTLQGQEWEVGLPSRPFEGGSASHGHLLLRPWAEHNESFNLLNGAQDAMPLSPKLFVGGHAYGLHHTNIVQGGIAQMQVELVEQHPKLGELKISGQYVQRLTLNGGPYLVILDQPASTVQVPVGRYAGSKVTLKKGGVEATMDNQTGAASRSITIGEKIPTVLAVGGPLTNSVSVSKQGKYLSLTYQLAGAGGAYQLVNNDRSHPPEFTVYRDDKKLVSGKFAYG
jgi:hypothetical protein